MRNNKYIRQVQYNKGFASLVLIGVVILIIVAGFVFWKREPWVKTFSDQQKCESSTGKSCVVSRCDSVQTTFWLDCPHGSSFWASTK